VKILVDGHRTAGRRYRLNYAGMYTPMGSANLTPGAHRVTIRFSPSNFLPGGNGGPFPTGPLILSRTTADLPVTYVSPAKAASLCGKSFDWIEALGP
jgi:hypothetical protein